ncbi:4-(cytidine 5'-diphospho)-2-C-methyl-D-erythritol kinase [Guyparkeria hydrothermalis]|uniref:4-(cytidine 5'-diphospho)-2-C-methyl-D-erythritol kinase n=1 Tax=Guyparkeria hydrothermalis TaxID=923 RepID=UPI002020BA39|nr:4-(cytidine 5'-diphospho)-2-C-methyl-D-erythritol kinase [Guyparkeria hydrothermalis]MCL7743896.1 4-(cytidine 5'-diphospho)-2-C-methyl-D-erythritol kinase [Guyparkeria hydrothermalis]
MPESHEPRWVSAGCKLNLFLHINGRRADGYHELQTHFLLLDYGDQIHIETGRGDGIHVDWIAGDEDVSGRPANPADDLLYRAADSLRKAAQGIAAKADYSARITLRKHAPVGGGLGGGSAAAAKVLLELNRRWGLRLSPEQLEVLGVRLGADVPVFLRGQSATAHGIGEVLHAGDIPDPPAWYLVLVPERGVATASLFASPDLVRDTPKQPDELLRRHWQDEGFNAFEPVVLANDPALAALRDDLASHAGFARLTGSGACLFAPVASSEEGQEIGARLQADHPGLRRFFVGRPLSTPNQEVSENGP